MSDVPPPPDGEPQDPFAPPRDGAEPPVDPTSDGFPPETEALPSTPAADSTPVEPSRPPIDATQVIPVVPSLPNAAAAPPGPYGSPPDGPYTTAPPVRPDPVAPPPNRSTAAVFGAVFVGVAVVAGLLIFFLTRGDDDDSIASDSNADVVRLIVSRVDPQSTPILTEVTATVTTADVFPIRWSAPAEAGRLPTAERSTDASGRTEFRWGPALDAGAGDAPGWSSVVDLRERWPDPTLAPPVAACTLERDGVSNQLATTVTVETGAGGTVDSLLDEATGLPVVLDAVVIRFPNVQLVIGDAVECELRGDAPPPFEPGAVTSSSTTTPESTTTVDSSTTTSTTVPESTTTTTTTLPATTTSTTTTTTSTTTTTTSTTTTTTTTTLPPPPTITEILADDPELGDFAALVQTAGLDDELENPAEPTTVFAPTDAAIEQLRTDRPDLDLSDPATAEAIVRAHVSVGERQSAAVLATRLSVPMLDGTNQPIDSTTPLVIAGALIERADLAAANGVVHVIDAVLPPGV